MIIINDNGFFKFYPEKISEIEKMQTVLFNEFAFYKNYFIPKHLFDLQGLHAKGENIDGYILENTTDNIEDLLHKNGFVYNFSKKRLAKFDEISNNNNIGQDIYCVSSYYLLEAGSFIKTQKIVSYFCRYNFREFMYKGIKLK